MNTEVAELNEKGRPTGRVEQVGFGDSPLLKKKRRTIYEQAAAGDIVIALGIVAVDAKKTKGGTHTEKRSAIFAVEQVTAEVSGKDIYDRWIDQGVIADARIQVEVWECRPAGYYRKRKAGR